MNLRFWILRKVGALVAALFAASTSAQHLDVKGTITGEGNAYFYQSVGIGTTSPGNKVSVSTPNANDGVALAGNAGLWSLLATNLGNGSYNGVVAAGDRGIIYGGSTMGTPGGGFVIAPWANGPSGLRLDQNGNAFVSGTVQQLVRDVTSGQVNAHLVRFTGWYGGTQPYIETQIDNTSVGISIFWSSKRFKKNVRDLQLDPKKISLLRPVEFEWDETKVPAYGKSIGLVAEDVYAVFPELVVMREGKPFSVSYELLSVVLLAELKEQQQEAVAIRGLLQSQQAEIDELKTAVRFLQGQSK